MNDHDSELQELAAIEREWRIRVLHHYMTRRVRASLLAFWAWC